MDKLLSFIERFKQAQKQIGKSNSQIAKEINETPQYLSRWLHAKSAKNLPPADIMSKIAKALNVDLLWLISGEGQQQTHSNILVYENGNPIPQGCVAIKEYKIAFDCGVLGGESEPSYEEITDSVPMIYNKDWFNSIGVNPQNCKRFKAHGDSMCPVICSGDSILVDCSYEARTHIDNGQIYAIWYDGTLLCKILTKSFSGGITISSVNSSLYPQEQLNSEDAKRFIIIGKVIERSGKITNYQR